MGQINTPTRPLLVHKKLAQSVGLQFNFIKSQIVAIQALRNELVSTLLLDQPTVACQKSGYNESYPMMYNIAANCAQTFHFVL